MRDQATTPLLGGRPEAQDPDAAASTEDSIQAEQMVKTWKRRRWVSFVASISLLIAFVAVLILSGGLPPLYLDIILMHHI